jgi:hypothetical protein
MTQKVMILVNPYHGWTAARRAIPCRPADDLNRSRNAGHDVGGFDESDHCCASNDQ